MAEELRELAATEDATAMQASAAAHVAALGGIRESTTSPAASGGSRNLPTAITEAAAQARQAARQSDGEQATLLGSVATWRHWQSLDLTRDEDAPQLPATAPLNTAHAELLDEEAIRGLDAARYALEVAAARGDEELRELIGGRARHLAVLTDAVADSPDPRDVAYDLTDVLRGGDPQQVAVQAEFDVMTAHLRLMASGDLTAFRRGVLLSAAINAAERARQLGADPPALPGLA